MAQVMDSTKSEFFEYRVLLFRLPMCCKSSLAVHFAFRFMFHASKVLTDSSATQSANFSHLLICTLSSFRLHAQALTLAALAGAAAVEYYEHKSGAKNDRHAKYLPIKSFTHKE